MVIWFVSVSRFTTAVKFEADISLLRPFEEMALRILHLAIVAAWACDIPAVIWQGVVSSSAFMSPMSSEKPAGGISIVVSCVTASLATWLRLKWEISRKPMSINPSNKTVSSMKLKIPSIRTTPLCSLINLFVNFPVRNRKSLMINPS